MSRGVSRRQAGCQSGKRYWPSPAIEGWMPPLRPEGTEGVAELGADGRPGAPAPRELHGRNLSEVGDAGGHPRGSSVPSQPRALGRNPFGIGDGVISKSHRGAIRKHRFAGEGEHGVAPFGLGGLGGIHQQVERGSQGASRQQAACRKRQQGCRSQKRRYRGGVYPGHLLRYLARGR